MKSQLNGCNGEATNSDDVGLDDALKQITGASANGPDPSRRYKPNFMRPVNTKNADRRIKKGNKVELTNVPDVAVPAKEEKDETPVYTLIKRDLYINHGNQGIFTLLIHVISGYFSLFLNALFRVFGINYVNPLNNFDIVGDDITFLGEQFLNYGKFYHTFAGRSFTHKLQVDVSPEVLKSLQSEFGYNKPNEYSISRFQVASRIHLKYIDYEVMMNTCRVFHQELLQHEFRNAISSGIMWDIKPAIFLK
jgi:hypothetical protein